MWQSSLSCCSPYPLVRSNWNLSLSPNWTFLQLRMLHNQSITAWNGSYRQPAFAERLRSLVGQAGCGPTSRHTLTLHSSCSKWICCALSWKMTHCLLEYAQLSSPQLPYSPLTSLFSGQSSNALAQAIADSAQSGVSHDTPSLALGFPIVEILDTILFCTCVSMYALGENEDSYRRSLPGCYFISCTRYGRWLGRHSNSQWSGPQSGVYHISGVLSPTLTNLSSRVAMSCLEGLYSSFVREVIHPQSLTIY